MTISLETMTVFRCKCIKPNCGHEWIARKKPTRCAKCKYLGWNGEDYRLPDPFIKVPRRSKVEPGEMPPEMPQYKETLSALVEAQKIIDQLVYDLSPCDHAKGICVCNEKRVLKRINRQIRRLGASPKRPTIRRHHRYEKTAAQA